VIRAEDITGTDFPELEGPLGRQRNSIQWKHHLMPTITAFFFLSQLITP
jgi:hypothetical protein